MHKVHNAVFFFLFFSLTSFLFNFTSVIPDNRYHSFAPPIDDVGARWFVDGKETFRCMADAIELAQSEILIAGWWVCPSIFMRRDEGDGPESRLDQLLKRKATAGVKINIIIWNETKIAMPLDSAYSKKELESLFPSNIHVLAHPYSVPINWTHHQKLLIVDQDIAFVGGLGTVFPFPIDIYVHFSFRYLLWSMGH